MRTMSATEASRNFSDLLDAVERGETVTVTRGNRPVQSSTVEGFDSTSRPASSTRNVPRATASPHCSKISLAEVAGGTPGLFALVDVMASPWARMRWLMFALLVMPNRGALTHAFRETAVAPQGIGGTNAV